MTPKLPAFLLAAHSQWCTRTADVSPIQQQAGLEALILAAEAYAQTPAYNCQLQLDELRTRIRRLEADLVAERTATLQLRRQLDHQRSPKDLSKADLEQLRTAEISRLRSWLGISEKQNCFTHHCLHLVQTEIRRRLTHLERKKVF